ncbi:MAG: hypothetical protein MJE77_19880 [Proteobacteria bacterium]|nr:hypothetical protein [Pseudomonadota bacterium]
MGLFALGTAGLSRAGYEAWRANDASRELGDLAPGVEWTDQLQATYERGQRAEKRATILLIAGGVGTVAGTVLSLVGWRSKPPTPASLAVIPHAGQGSAGVVVRMGF